MVGRRCFFAVFESGKMGVCMRVALAALGLGTFEDEVSKAPVA